MFFPSSRPGRCRGARSTAFAHGEGRRNSHVVSRLPSRSAGRTFLCLLGLGGVALLVGGIGVANTMVISVLERRSEIGLRRALGATRRQIHAQFVTESLILSALGGLGGVTLGALVTIGYAVHQGWPWDLPPWAALAGVGLTVLIGVIAGLYPASRASRTSPTAALSAS